MVLAGQKYLQTVYDFIPANLWRNIGINAAFFGFFAILVTYVSLVCLISSTPILTFRRIGMERFKTPAGRMATIFYSTDISQHRKVGGPSASTDEEKGSAQDTDSGEIVRQGKRVPTSDAIKFSERRFAWKDLCLDIQVGKDHRRLLTNVSGETAVIES
jgi:hypothetical protein